MSIQANNPLRRAALPSLTAGVVVTVLLAAGCSYRMDRIENPVKLPTAWDATNTPNAKTGVDKEWWKSFGSPVLNQLVEEALKGNPSIIATEERLKQAERTLSQAHDGLFPELSVNASTSKGRSGTSGAESLIPGGPSPNGSRNTESTSASLSLRYDVDLWGATAARYRASVASFAGTKYDADLAHINLAAQVARAYFTLLGTRSRVEVAQKNLEIAERLLRIIQVRYDNGVVRQYDLLQQSTTVLQQRTNLIPLENQLRQNETALGLLLGRTPQEFHVEGEPINDLAVPEIAPWLPGDLLLRRPDMATAETAMASAKANLVVARASLIPVTLSVSGNVSQSSTELLTLTDTRNWSLQGALAIATGIFNYRQRHNSYLNAKSNEYIQLVNYAQTIRTALKDVDDNLASVNANLRTEDSQRATLDQARRAMAQAELQVREGSGDREDLDNAQRSLFQAEDSLAQQRITRLNSAISLYVALGGGWEGPSESDLQRLQTSK